MKIGGILWFATLFVFLVGQRAFPADLDNNGKEDNYEQALAEKFCLNYGTGSLQESIFFPFSARQRIVRPWQDKHKGYLSCAWAQNSSYERNSLFLLSGNFLAGENTESDEHRAMGIGEQIAEAYFGGVVGGLLGTYITWQVIQIQYGETEEDWGGVRAYLALLGGTAGVSVGSAVWLDIQRGGNRRRLGWAFLGAAIPTALMTAMELTFHPTKGHFPYVLMLSWGLAPIGAVIGYNLAD